jgi:ADP-ribose pyrophosphatase YjhB (NUDIX family)
MKILYEKRKIMSNKYYYKGPNPTVDLIIVNPEGKILLIQREELSPDFPDMVCAGMWAIPGGFVDADPSIKKGDFFKYGEETTDQAAVRELQEETNFTLVNPKLIFIGEYEGNNRDPRDSEEAWSKSHAYIYVIPEEIYKEQKDKIQALSDAKEYGWKSPEEIEALDMAFDHKQIIRDGLAKLKPNSKLKM